MTRRQERYGKVVRGWTWRATPEDLKRFEKMRIALNMGKSEIIEKALNFYEHFKKDEIDDSKR